MQISTQQATCCLWPSCLARYLFCINLYWNIYHSICHGQLEIGGLLWCQCFNSLISVKGIIVNPIQGRVKFRSVNMILVQDVFLLNITSSYMQIDYCLYLILYSFSSSVRYECMSDPVSPESVLIASNYEWSLDKWIDSKFIFPCGCLTQMRILEMYKTSWRFSHRPRGTWNIWL